MAWLYSCHHRAWTSLQCREWIYASTDYARSAWVSKCYRYQWTLSLYAQPDLFRLHFVSDWVFVRIEILLGLDFESSVYPVNECARHSIRRGLSGEKIRGRIHQLQVPREPVVVK